MPCEREYTPYNNPGSFASAGQWASAQRGTALENYWATAHAQLPPNQSDWQTYHRVDTGKGIADFLHVNPKERRFFFEDWEKQRDTARLWGGALFIGRFRSAGFLNSLKSRPEFEKQVPN